MSLTRPDEKLPLDRLLGQLVDQVRRAKRDQDTGAISMLVGFSQTTLKVLGAVRSRKQLQDEVLWKTYSAEEHPDGPTVRLHLTDILQIIEDLKEEGAVEREDNFEKLIEDSNFHQLSPLTKRLLADPRGVPDAYFPGLFDYDTERERPWPGYETLRTKELKSPCPDCRATVVRNEIAHEAGCPRLEAP